MPQMRWKAELEWGLVFLMVTSGCKVYHRLPLDRGAKDAALAEPDLARIQVQAGELKHPILKPLHVDLRNGLSADEAAVLAVIANPDLRAVRDQRALAAAQLLDAGLLPDPVLSYGQDFPEQGQAGTVTADSLQLSLDLTAILTRGMRHRAARFAQQAVQLDVAWQEWQVAEGAKLSVYRLMALESQVTLAEEGAALQVEILKGVEQAAAHGDMSLGELVLARTNCEAGQRSALSLRQARDRERLALNGLLGLAPHQRVELEKTATERLWDALPSEAALLQQLDQRLDLVALQQGYQSQDARLRLAVWSQFPSIGLSVNRSRDASAIVTQGYAVAVSLPLFNRARGLVAVEDATRQQLHDQYLARLYHARSEVVQLLADLRAIREQIAAARAALPALAAQARGAEQAFAQGALERQGLGLAQLAILTQQATLAALQGSLDELGVALEIASGQSSQEPAK